MDRLSTYLCGPIRDCSDANCKDWREYAKSRLTTGVFDPLVRDYRGREDAHAAEIVEADKSDMDNCHYVLVNYTRPSTGTDMEILYAWERGKEVIVVVPHNDSVSPWLQYHATCIYRDIDDAVAHINRRHLRNSEIITLDIAVEANVVLTASDVHMLCPVNGLTDSANVRVEYQTAGKAIELGSFHRYLRSFKQIRILHEDFTSEVARVVHCVAPTRVKVTTTWLPVEGIGAEVTVEL